ncbi:MAG TPA: hypothetical protein VF797_01255 [Noviherbaspirillum sp.]
MSNQSSAAAQLQSMPSSTFRQPGEGFWRSLFNAWVASYGNRIDPEGKVLIEL